jgi:hypothetical protein
LLSSARTCFPKKAFSFRGHSLTKVEKAMNGEWRKEWQEMEKYAGQWLWRK